MATFSLTIDDWHPPRMKAFRWRHSRKRDSKINFAASLFRLHALAQKVPFASGPRKVFIRMEGWTRGAEPPAWQEFWPAVAIALHRAELVLSVDRGACIGAGGESLRSKVVRTTIILSDVVEAVK